MPQTIERAHPQAAHQSQREHGTPDSSAPVVAALAMGCEPDINTCEPSAEAEHREAGHREAEHREADGATAARPGGETFCGVAEAIALLGDAWTLLLIRDLASGPRRFKDLRTSTTISPRVLTDRLRAMASEGLVTRRMFPEIPPRVEYQLTDRGRAALPVLEALREFGEEWLHP